MKFEDALKLARSKRSKINPNSGFVQQLKDFELEMTEGEKEKIDEEITESNKDKNDEKIPDDH